MNEKEKIRYINTFVNSLTNMMIDGLSTREVLSLNKEHYLSAPKKLYRYCNLEKNNYTFESIEKQYLYLSPADTLDDDFECFVNEIKIDSENIKSIVTSDHYFSYFIKQLLLKYKMYDPSAHVYFQKDSIGNKEKLRNYLLNKDCKEEIINEIIESVKRFILNDTFQKNLIDFAKWFSDTKEKTGVCSLTENNRSQIMWNLYGDAYKGCMIEYDFPLTDINNIIDLFPVIYSDDRKTDSLEIAIDVQINSLNTNPRVAFFEKFKALYSLISIKNTEWKMQKEWRIVGQPKQRSASPRIAAIYLGQKVNRQNREKIIALSKRLKFKVFDQSFDRDRTTIVYNEIPRADDLEKKKNYTKKYPGIEFTFDEIDSLEYSKRYYLYLQSLDRGTSHFLHNEQINNIVYDVIEQSVSDNRDVLYEIFFWNDIPNSDEIKCIYSELEFKRVNYETNTGRFCPQYRLIIFSDMYNLFNMSHFSYIHDQKQGLLLIEKNSYETIYGGLG